MVSSNGTFHLESPAFRDGELIPLIHTCEGLNLSPPLRWSGAPEHTRSYALLLEDLDSPAGSWVHWLLFNIPAALRALPAGLERAPELPNGARHGSCWGVGRFERIGYQGPLPPAGLAIYRVINDQNARSLFNEAQDQMDERKMEQVAQEYFPTSFGDGALSWLAEVSADRGAPRGPHQVLAIGP